MSDKFSQLLPMLGAIVAFLFAALLLVYIVRLVFGRRIRAPGARNRPRRLDIVDVFDLDKERQLVIVRRDNTEHLLLIGGPNDVLVESAISRVEGVVGRTETNRAEASSRAASTNWPAAPAVEEEAAPTPPSAAAPIKPAVPAGLNLPSDMVAPKPAAPKPIMPPPLRPATPPPAAEPAAPTPPAPPAPGPVPTRPLAGGPPPLRPAAPPRQAPPPFLGRTQQIIKPRSEEGDTPATGEVKMTPPPLPPRPAAPPLRPTAPPPPPLRPASAPGVEAPVVGAEPTPPAPSQVRMGIPPQRPVAPPPVPPAPPAPPSGGPGDALESLEEEMARLLGRPEKE